MKKFCPHRTPGNSGDIAYCLKQQCKAYEDRGPCYCIKLNREYWDKEFFKMRVKSMLEMKGHNFDG